MIFSVSRVATPPCYSESLQYISYNVKNEYKSTLLTVYYHFISLSSKNTSHFRGNASNLDQFFKSLQVAYLAGSPKVWWPIAHRFLEALQQGNPFCAGNVEVFHSFREGVQADVKKGLEV